MSGLRALCARLGRPTLPERSADGPSRALALAAVRAAAGDPASGCPSAPRQRPGDRGLEPWRPRPASLRWLVCPLEGALPQGVA